VAVRTYQVKDPSVAAPIRLSFHKLGARVAHRCGQWPDDLSGIAGNRGFKNENYWNFGCSTQQNLAAQVADPVDLVRPRTMERADTVKRTRGLEDLRKAKDPSTVYQQQGPKINQGVGN
jgi:pilus assembly protein CpaD